MAHTDTANMTALQKHVSFFDRNKDGIITPSETFEGDWVYATNSVRFDLTKICKSHIYAN